MGAKIIGNSMLNILFNGVEIFILQFYSCKHRVKSREIYSFSSPNLPNFSDLHFNLKRKKMSIELKRLFDLPYYQLENVSIRKEFFHRK